MIVDAESWNNWLGATTKVKLDLEIKNIFPNFTEKHSIFNTRFVILVKEAFIFKTKFNFKINKETQEKMENESRLASGSMDRSVKIWDPSGNLPNELTLNPASNIYSLVYFKQ